MDLEDPVRGDAVEQPEDVRDAAVAVERLTIGELPGRIDADRRGRSLVVAGDVDEPRPIDDVTELPASANLRGRSAARLPERGPTSELEQPPVVVVELDERRREHS